MPLISTFIFLLAMMQVSAPIHCLGLNSQKSQKTEISQCKQLVFINTNLIWQLRNQLQLGYFPFADKSLIEKFHNNLAAIIDDLYQFEDQWDNNDLTSALASFTNFIDRSPKLTFKYELYQNFLTIFVDVALRRSFAHFPLQTHFLFIQSIATLNTNEIQLDPATIERLLGSWAFALNAHFQSGNLASLEAQNLILGVVAIEKLTLSLELSMHTSALTCLTLLTHEASKKLTNSHFRAYFSGQELILFLTTLANIAHKTTIPLLAVPEITEFLDKWIKTATKKINSIYFQDRFNAAELSQIIKAFHWLKIRPTPSCQIFLTAWAKEVIRKLPVWSPLTATDKFHCKELATLVYSLSQVNLWGLPNRDTLINTLIDALSKEVLKRLNLPDASDGFESEDLAKITAAFKQLSQVSQLDSGPLVNALIKEVLKRFKAYDPRDAMSSRALAEFLTALAHLKPKESFELEQLIEHWLLISIERISSPIAERNFETRGLCNSILALVQFKKPRYHLLSDFLATWIKEASRRLHSDYPQDAFTTQNLVDALYGLAQLDPTKDRALENFLESWAAQATIKIKSLEPRDLWTTENLSQTGWALSMLNQYENFNLGDFPKEWLIATSKKLQSSSAEDRFNTHQLWQGIWAVDALKISYDPFVYEFISAWSGQAVKRLKSGHEQDRWAANALLQSIITFGKLGILVDDNTYGFMDAWIDEAHKRLSISHQDSFHHGHLTSILSYINRIDISHYASLNARLQNWIRAAQNRINQK